jgi:hypothetical protein
MARPTIPRFVCSDKSLERGLNALVAELNRLGKWSTDGRIGFSNGEDGPKQWLNARSATSPIVRARITSAGLTARTGTSPDFTCGTGKAIRYTFDGATRTLGTVEEDVFNDYPVLVTGPRDAWFAEIGGNLYLMPPNCTSD